MDGGIVFRPGVPGLPPGASTFSTPLPQKAPGGSRGTPGRTPSSVPCDTGSNQGNGVPSSGMDGGIVFSPGVPGLPPGASTFSTPLPQKAPGGSRGTPGRTPSSVPCDTGSNQGNGVPSSGMDGGIVFSPGVPGLPPGASTFSTPLPQKAPGGSRGTPGRTPSSVPCDTGSNQGNGVPSSGMDGGIVFSPGVPGLPPGASWHGDLLENGR